MLIFNTEFQKRPLFFRLLEGISSLCMPVGFLWAGGDIFTSLFLIYLLHFITSFLFHVYPTPLTYYLDISIIDILSIEQFYYKTQNLWVYVLCMLSMWIEHVKSHETVVFRAGILTIITLCVKQNVFLYALLWMITITFFISSFFYLERNHILLTTLTCCLYHFYLGMISAMEVEMYLPQNNNSFHEFSRYCFSFLFLFHVASGLTHNPKRLCSILSFATAVVLTPFSMHQIYKQLQMKEMELYQDHTQSSIILFYLSYVLIDMTIGNIYYPTFFSLLDGWIHHIATSIFMIYYLFQQPKKQVLPCMCLIIETSTVLLCLSRICYDVLWIQKIKKIFFYNMFVLFRIIIPTLLTIYYYSMCDIIGLFGYVSITFVNIYWLVKLSKKKT